MVVGNDPRNGRDKLIDACARAAKGVRRQRGGGGVQNVTMVASPVKYTAIYNDTALAHR